MRNLMYVGGKWTAGIRGLGAEAVLVPVLNPANGEVITQVPHADADDVDHAVESAAEAFESWARTAPAVRAAILLRAADILEKRTDEAAGLETANQGQPLRISRGFALPKTVECLRYHAGWATKITGTTAALSVPDADFRTVREPLGVCGLITPWNFPLMILMWKVAPALAAGNTVVIKPSEITPLTTLLFAEILEEAGAPPGVVNVVLGGGDIGRHLVAHRKVRKISFTGSTKVGKEIASVCGAQLKKYSLELGGKNASIVCPDANVDDILEQNVFTAFINAGQVCGSATRFYVHQSLVDEFVEKFAAAADQLVVGPGDDPRTDVGPVASAGHLASIDRYVQLGKAQGAQLVTGGYRITKGNLGRGNFYRPTVFRDVQQDMTIAREEIFGPVSSILTYTDNDDPVALANDSDYGLAAYVWTRDVARAHRYSRDIKAGSVYVNLGTDLDHAAPWGGMKDSGVGREMGWEAIESYTQIKSCWVGLR